MERMGIYDQILVSCWIGFFGVWAATAFFFRSHGGPVSSARRAAFRLAIFLALFLVFRYSGRARSPSFVTPSIVAAAGASICIAGVGFAIWARFALGRSWGMPMTVREHTELVTSGPYSYVRHPIYAGVSAMMIGTALVHPPVAAPAVILIAYFLFSLRREEHDMERQFPNTYPAYKRRTKRLLPFLL